MPALAPGSLQFANNALTVADQGPNKDSFSVGGVSQEKPMVLQGHGYPLNGSAHYGPWNAYNYSYWPIAPGLEIGNEAGVDVYGVVKAGQPLFSPNLLDGLPGGDYKYHALWGLFEQDPGTSMIISGLVYLSDEWHYFITAVADRRLLNSGGAYATPDTFPLGLEHAVLNPGDNFGIVNNVHPQNYRKVAGLGTGIKIVDADSLTLTGVTDPPITYSPGTGFFTGKIYDAVWCGNITAYLGAQPLPWHSPIGNLMYEGAVFYGS